MQGDFGNGGVGNTPAIHSNILSADERRRLIRTTLTRKAMLRQPWPLERGTIDDSTTLRNDHWNDRVQ